ncbi:hypothetical protein DC522_05740 [Microvirga sp. KLBC 81]|uniref:hypothetical protein n=1 Tax=Microvirga sp. KLBC 81 TaxID=1862707 RepID=UPI000D5143D9|nr:hypothetical protein [Microvirga sp. KLBC 81]PVE25399.1 hypothetical protein DC522_05740 [Microvirga sp. KLBC 81]
MAQHTPGPWEAKNDHPTEPRIFYIRGTHPGGWEQEIAVLYNENGENARLIAAAPDLLEALDWLVTALKTGTLATSGDLIGKAEAVIAKAEGR